MSEYAQFEMFLTKLIILEYDEVGLNMMKCKKIIETLKVVTEPYLQSRILKQPNRINILFSCIIQFDNNISKVIM